jgi:arginyl-tRNA synthetase
VAIAGPGFINLTLSSAFLAKALFEQHLDPHLGIPTTQHPQKVIVEFSSPNVAKELHVGHLRSTIIGDCLARTLQALGHTIVRLNHIGDWGTQFGMLIAYIEKHHIAVSSTTELSELMTWYRAAKEEFDHNPDFKQQAKQRVVHLQSGEANALRIWTHICNISRQGFQEIYDLLHIDIQERGESFYNSYLPQIVQELEDKGLVTLSEGAKCVFLEEFKGRDQKPLPTIIQKSDGGYNYDTTELATLYHRLRVEKADRIIIVTDIGQSLHFQMVFAIGIQAGWLQPNITRVDHVPFGLVLGPDGKKFKTRSGETERLIDLIHGAVAKALDILQQRGSADWPQEELSKLAQTLGVNAIKYADLASSRTKDYLFSYDRMLQFEGNTAAFLLYAYVRTKSILDKATQPLQTDAKAFHLTHPSEETLAFLLLRFGDVVVQLAEDLLPHKLADYLYHLAEGFHQFFKDCRVHGSKEEANRLLLCQLTSQVLQRGLDLLGLKTVPRM